MKDFIKKVGYNTILTIMIGFALWALRMNVVATVGEQLKDYTRQEQFLEYSHSHQDKNAEVIRRFDDAIKRHDSDFAEIKQALREIQSELMRRNRSLPPPPPPILPLKSPKELDLTTPLYER